MLLPAIACDPGAPAPGAGSASRIGIGPEAADVDVALRALFLSISNKRFLASLGIRMVGSFGTPALRAPSVSIWNKRVFASTVRMLGSGLSALSRSSTLCLLLVLAPFVDAPSACDNPAAAAAADASFGLRLVSAALALNRRLIRGSTSGTKANGSPMCRSTPGSAICCPNGNKEGVNGTTAGLVSATGQDALLGGGGPTL